MMMFGRRTEKRKPEPERQLYFERKLARRRTGLGNTQDSRRMNAFLTAALVIGLFLLIYPSAADYWNTIHQKRAIMDYASQVASMDRSDYEAMIRSAEDYNRRLAENKIKWEMSEEELADYEKQLSFNESRNMGFITIPKISLELPVYHGISYEVLQRSIGHMPETSLPVGGESSHCVLSGHRGLPSAKLFSDLDKLTEGDTFTLSILDESYTYEVDQIRVVVPSELAEIRIIPGLDLCTLVTCTPYGVNTHRLLVRGHRVDNPNGNALVVADAMQLEPVFVTPFLMIPLICGLLLLLLFAPVNANP